MQCDLWLRYEGVNNLENGVTAEKTKGNLSILSGNGLKSINAEGVSDVELKNRWQGVVIYCKLSIQNIKDQLHESSGSDIDAILKEILG